MNIQFLMMIFPVAFMIHDFEELCFLENWIRKNADAIRHKLTGKIWIRLEGHSTSALGIAIMLMFLFVSFTSIVSVIFHFYSLFAAALIVFTAHNLFHILQPILLWTIYSGHGVRYPHAPLSLVCFALHESA